MTVTVYSSPSCMQCNATKKYLNRMNIEFEEVDVSVNQEARDELTDLGYTQVPVVRFGETHFAGFRPDRLKEIVTA